MAYQFTLDQITELERLAQIAQDNSNVVGKGAEIYEYILSQVAPKVFAAYDALRSSQSFKAIGLDIALTAELASQSSYKSLMLLELAVGDGTG